MENTLIWFNVSQGFLVDMPYFLVDVHQHYPTINMKMVSHIYGKGNVPIKNNSIYDPKVFE